jgi:hypothetical protein
MKKRTKKTVFISKVRETKTKDLWCFWYQINQGETRETITGKLKDMMAQRLALIEKYKSEHIKLGV